MARKITLAAFIVLLTAAIPGVAPAACNIIVTNVPCIDHTIPAQGPSSPTVVPTFNQPVPGPWSPNSYTHHCLSAGNCYGVKWGSNNTVLTIQNTSPTRFTFATPCLFIFFYAPTQFGATQCGGSLTASPQIGSVPGANPGPGSNPPCVEVGSAC